MDQPIVDWDLSVSLAGNNLTNAREYIDFLLKDLSKELTIIKQCHASLNYDEIKLRVHKLRGGLCYCGLPRLNSVTLALEQALKNNRDIQTLLVSFENEIWQAQDVIFKNT